MSKAAALVSPDEAPGLVRELTSCKGWRKRVVAAKVACAFQLCELVPPLVGTFAMGPEHYTADAFAKLISSLDILEGRVLFAELRRACPAGEYGRHLLEVIENASDSKADTGSVP